mgnify:CR=1 FL=1
MATKKAKKGATVPKFWAVKEDGTVNIYRAMTRPSVIATSFSVRSGGRILCPITGLCSQATPLFKDLAVGDVKEVEVKLG